MQKLPKSNDSNLITQESADELLIYNLSTNKVYCLNETAAFIWLNCDGKKTIADLKLMNNQLSDDLIFLTLDLLNKKQLLGDSAETDFPIETIDRRKMIAKYGTLAFALPMISTMVAPLAVNAQSCVNSPNFVDSSAGICVPVGDLSRCIALNPLTCCPGTAPSWMCTALNDTCFGGCIAT